MKLLPLLTIVTVASASPREFDEVMTNADVQLLQATLSLETKLEDRVNKTATTNQAAPTLVPGLLPGCWKDTPFRFCHGGRNLQDCPSTVELQPILVTGPHA